MKKNNLFFILIIASNLLVLSNFNQLKAQDNTIYIRSDGTVEGTNLIVKEGTVDFVLLGNIEGKSIVVERSITIVDGRGFTIQGNGENIGIYLLRGGTIKNVNVDNFTIGISVKAERKAHILGCNITNNNIGIKCAREDHPIYDNIISGNNVVGNGIGIQIVMGNDGDKTNMLVAGNNIENNDYAMGFNLDQVGRVYTPYPMNVRIYKNDFVNNNQTAKYGMYMIDAFPVYVWSYRNIWISTFEKKGNYWGDYNGTDNDENGIGDEGYRIDLLNYDYYPLTEPIEQQIIPEFSSWIIAPLFLISTLTILVYRKKFLRQKLLNN